LLTVTALAKLNLTLEVLGKRPDGFHEIRSVIQAVSLCDYLSLRLSRNVEFASNLPEWRAGRSLISRAVRLLQEAMGCAQGVEIFVDKHIPLVAGLGGDSSGAAACLRGLNQLWGLDLPREVLVELAARLGSDVAFFLYGGTALAEGRGELVTPLESSSRVWVVLLIPPVPPVPDKTKRLYASLKPAHFTAGEATSRLVTYLAAGRELALTDLFNVFDKVAADTFVGLVDYRQRFLAAGARKVCLAGAGPSLFTLERSRAQAVKVYRGLQAQGFKCYLTEFISDF